MRKLKISVGKLVLHVLVDETPTGDAILGAVPFETRAVIWPGEIYFQAPIRAEREDGAREVVEKGELAFRHEGESIVIAYGPTPCSEGDEIRLAVPANIWGRTADELDGLRDVEAGQLVKVEKAE